MAESGGSGSARAASEAIERWLRDRRVVSDEAVENVLFEVRRMVKRLGETAMIRNDAAARAALDAMAQTADIDAMTEALDRLDARVGTLLQSRASGPRPAPRMPAETAGQDEAANAPRLARTFLRL